MSAIRYYTDAFDQEMLDFIKHELQMEADNEDEWDVTHEHLVYSSNLGWYWTCKIRSPENYEYLTKQQFKQKIGMEGNMTTKQFSKKDLVVGMLVTLRNGIVYTVSDNLYKMVRVNPNDHVLLLDYRDDLLCDGLDMSEWDVVSVSTLVGKREEKSSTQIELEKLQNQIADLQVRANKLQSTL